MFSNCEVVAIPREWWAPEPEPISWHEDDEAIRILLALPGIDKYVAELEDEGESDVAEELCIPTESTLAERFREQAHKWGRETQHLSSPAQMMMHPSYQAILGMALENKKEIIRLLIIDLQQHRKEWFWALSFLTQENPITPSDAGKMDRMIAAWVNWGRAKRII
jgi:hypothetical protein